MLHMLIDDLKRHTKFQLPTLTLQMFFAQKTTNILSESSEPLDALLLAMLRDRSPLIAGTKRRFSRKIIKTTAQKCLK